MAVSDHQQSIVLLDIKNRLGHPPDLVIRTWNGKEKVVYLSTLVNEERVVEEIIRPLLDFSTKSSDSTDFDAVITSSQVEAARGADEQISSLLKGFVIVLASDGSVWRINLKNEKKRSINEPAQEKAVRGPKDGFIEDLATNMGLVRQRLQSQDLRVEEHIIGDAAGTTTVLFYVQPYVKENILDEVRGRLRSIQLQAIIDASYIEEWIKDNRWSPFPTMEYTERPDKMVSAILQGRVAIMADGSPTCLLVPTIFAHFLMASEDQYVLPYAATLVRWLRLMAMFIAFALPSLFIALTTIHHGMIPPFLGVTIAKARIGLPLPIVMEVVMMEVLMELVREAGLRMPGPLGQSVTIVGTLVIGEAAVTAGIVSAPVVIVVSLTTLASFAIPGYHMALAIRLLRFPMMLLASVLGLVGIVWYIMLILIHLGSIRSFGIPYLTPAGPWLRQDIKDTLFRLPRWKLNGNPSYARRKK
ncbi:spore germination protein [uncultured Paenibacillus sp.]|uniref:spore germination protein n=1 Tax=uncultured Paenibacillus sp. TaxID=227322 RepID=UPI0028D5FC6B|nr:spore germination protein [uncultured Paenibacillus sp.]